ncbi:putative outer membrane starch-binding protein [Bacteroides zoogleoformans]|uniref:RagB/SusD family nutrient uptake outer membrane protein n=1 Tax=Bacteroides zoogleoformans TaxID=28119 RepID=A0ABM6TAR2_9BACE|nr:RagB/SusD family nutrient uptake outer membrane protein [Bacteroides zoogleoformans]AVM53882.1 RagB/SusD family nutrient uptake outer membrane protein [Bacteroides zoogleoformans]TWJ10935.1 putative outer membrane starch-binding protein [Bacteroides zoogleoformans]
MRNYREYMAALSLFLGGIFAGCEDIKFGEAFLEKPLSNEYTIDSVFNKKIFAEQALAEAYHSLPDFLPSQGRMGYGVLEILTDIGDWTKKGAPKFYTGTVDATNDFLEHLPYRPDTDKNTRGVGPIYGLRRAYIYLENVDRVPDMSDEEKAFGKGEAKMIIAYHYVQMLRYYGGMPWIDHAYTAGDEMMMPRMTVQETVEKIVGLLDEAAALLPWEWKNHADDDGRMTAAAALALKSRVLQFAASPLFNAEKPYKEGEAASAHLVWYGNYSSERWQKALDAGLSFLRENNKHGGIYRLVNTGNPREDFVAGYFKRNNHETLISSRRFTTYMIGKTPFAQIRYGVASPTLNYVDMFQMNDGTEFDWNNPDHKKNPFFDASGHPRRDIRLYETVAVTGDKFRGQQKVEIYEGTQQYPYKSGRMSYNGFAMRKFIRNFNEEVNGEPYICPLLRLPEVYLNMAEAMNELGKANVADEFGHTAYDYVNLVRSRAGMPPLTAATTRQGEPLREAILRERALEFGYEEVRYFDLVRWKRSDLFTKPLSRLIIKKAGKNYTYKVSTAMAEQRKHVRPDRWDEKYFLLPLPISEINKKYGLTQNPGW